jgi:hypothetical protein
MRPAAAATLWLCLSLLAGAAQGQTKKELAAKVLALQREGIESIGRALAGQTAQQMLQAASQAMSRMPADQRDAAAKDVQADVKRFYDEVEPLLRDRAVKLAPAVVGVQYEEKFSEDELKQIVAWLESPVFKRFSQLDREMGSGLAQKVVAEARPAVDPKLKALEASIAKRLGISPPARAASSPPARAASSALKPAP